MKKKRGCLKRIAIILAGFVFVLTLIAYAAYVLPITGIPFNGKRHTNTPITPAWALECWIWEDDHNTAAFTLELIDGYLEHDFPVRAILIDSPWSMRYNDFVVDEERFPDPEQFFTDLDARGIRVVLWATNNVNSYSKDTAQPESEEWFREAADNGYLTGDGYEFRWWKGRGGFIDYTNPEAMAWWQGAQQQLFDWGIDGWKLDGTATYFSSRLGPLIVPYQKTHAGWMSMRGYMDHYYRDEYQHGLTQNPDFVTLSRSIDSPLPWVHREGFAPLDASPVNWVGDNTHTWEDEELGLQRALKTILDSAKLGYSVVGSDIAGYHGDTKPTPELYIRWAQFSTFCGLFLNGGHGERRMWKRSEQELEIVRTYSWLHTELVPYMYSHIVAAHDGGPPLMRPQKKGKFHYLFGDDFLVAPIYDPAPDHEVVLPKGRWRYLFDDTKVIEGPTTFRRSFPLDEYPVYIRDGAIIPMNIARDYTGIGQRDWAGHLTLNIYPHGENTFTAHHTDKSGALTVTVSEHKTSASPGTVRITLQGEKKPVILRVLAQTKPTQVHQDGQQLTETEEWRYDDENDRVIIRPSTHTAREYKITWANPSP